MYKINKYLNCFFSINFNKKKFLLVFIEVIVLETVKVLFIEVPKFFNLIISKIIKCVTISDSKKSLRLCIR